MASPATAAGSVGGQWATWLAVAALAVNYGARGVIPVVAHVVCKSSGCDAADLIGSVASAFFTGDLLAQAAAKPLVRRLGGRRLLSAGTAGFGASLALVARLVNGPWAAFLAAQGVLGFCCGLGYPASHALIAEMVPAPRRSTAVSLITGASAGGTMLSNFATPLAVDYFGWLTPFLFFCLAASATAVFVEVLCPAPSTAQTSVDGHRLQAAAGGATELRKWLADPLVQALVLAMYASGVANAFLYSFIPTLFVEVYKVQLSELAGLTAAAPLLNAMTCVISGVAADRFIAGGWAPHRCRGLMQLLGTAIPAASLLGLAGGAASGSYAGSVLVTVWMAAHGCQTAGLTATFHDVGKLRASELFAVGNVFSKLAGVIAGQAFSRLARARGWEAVLLVISGHYVVSGAVLISLLGRSDKTRRLITPPSDDLPQEELCAGSAAEHEPAKPMSLLSPAPSIASVGSTCLPDLDEDERSLRTAQADLEWQDANVSQSLGPAACAGPDEEAELLEMAGPESGAPSEGSHRRAAREGGCQSPGEAPAE